MPSNDTLTIDTPEQIALELPLAGIGSRFLALVIDSFIQMLAAIITVLALYFLFPRGLGWSQAFLSAALILILFCLYWGYFAFFEIIWNGQTPGKRITGIRVIKESGRPISPVEAIGRNLMRSIDMLGLYLVGIICMMISAQNKRLGDYVAGTVVVYDQALKAAGSAWSPDNTATLPDFRTSKITPEMLLLIETFFSRRAALDTTVRRKTAREIATLIENKTGIKHEADQSPEDFLKSVAQKVRNGAGYR